MFEWIGALFKPAVDLIDELHVSDEEKGKLRNEFARIKASMHEKSIDLMKAEAASEHWIVAAWRPMCAIMLFSLIVADAYGFAKAPAQVYDLANIFLGTYAGGRSLEKIGKIVKGVAK